ncbi:MAG: DUF3426 domain-containing protein [Desulfobacteraceae bacterium]|nr:DUF3426 domain-containing protein [Desulfobacteraceae bacterium]
MIITCGKCDTSYELNEGLVKEKGSKVRCKNCSHVFTVFPPLAYSIIEPEPDLELESFSDDSGLSNGMGSVLESLDMNDIEKMLESQSVLGPDSLKITEEEPELSLADMEEKSGTLKHDFNDDLDFLDLSDIEKMLDTEVAQGSASLRITDQEPELSLEPEAGAHDGKQAMDDGDSLDLSDIEKMLDSEEVKGPDSVRITDQEPELSLEMDAGGKSPSPVEDSLDLPDLESLLDMEDPRGTEELNLTDDEMDLSLESDDPKASSELLPNQQEEALELEFDFDDEVLFDDDPNQELKLEMEGAEESDFVLDMEADGDSDLELELDLDLDELEESESEEAALFEIKSETRVPPVRKPPAKPAEQVFELDLEEPDQAPIKPKKSDEFVLKSKEKAKSDAFAMGAGAAPKKPVRQDPAYRHGREPEKKSNAITYILLLLLILAGGAFGVMKYGEQLGLKLPSMEGFMPEKGKMVVIESSLKNNFIDNAKIGSLLVITGNIQNKFNKERSHVQVSVDVLGIDKTLIKSDVVYCGNLVKSQSLMNDDMSTVKRLLMIPDGELRTNINIKPGGMVPFMVVFSDLPGSVKEFQVKVAGSEPAKK